jgi:uncharacterized protein (DUF433 family)
MNGRVRIRKCNHGKQCIRQARVMITIINDKLQDGETVDRVAAHGGEAAISEAVLPAASRNPRWREDSVA